MTTGKQLAGLLLLTTALTYPGAAFAQGTAGDANAGLPGSAPTQQGPDEVTSQQETLEQIEGVEPGPEEFAEEPEISAPGGEIIVTGRISRDPVRNATQAISVLSSEQIARTGEGDIAGALARVTGLSVQSNGFVFVRGLGDRYSLALLNGLPLPSPQPLSRVVPLDIFPTNVVSSSLVQKTYSANYPGEFGGGVINLTTRAVPDESFVTIGGGLSGDTETTGQSGYSYFGSGTDWTGFDNGARDIPPALQAYYQGRQTANELDRASQRALLKDLVDPSFVTLQKIGKLPVNFSGSVTAGTSFDVFSDGRLGVIATAALNNSWRNRVIRREFTQAEDLSGIETQADNHTTDNRILVNGLLGFGLEVADHRFRFTNLFIRDTVKQSVLALGQNFNFGANGINTAVQNTAWYERQLLDSQFVGELEFDDLAVDLRAGYAQTQRESPFEYSFAYSADPTGLDIYQGLYRNNLADNETNYAEVVFSDLTEDVYYGGLDISYPLLDWLTATAGYAYTKTERYSTRREFSLRSSNFDPNFSLFSPAYILSDAIIDFGDQSGNYLLEAREISQNFPAFQADLEIHAGYGQLRLEPVSGMIVDVGVRYEDAVQSVEQDATIFDNPPAFVAETDINNDYFLPAGTLTYEFSDGLQGRLSASKTIARPQFRELIFQAYTDPESNRLFQGNPLLQDSELTNYEARLEFYPGGGARALVAGFYKDIERPIETYLSVQDGRVLISFANAPRAQLYGAEAELEYRYDLFDMGGWFETKEVLLVANYTYTQSEIQVDEGDTTAIFGSAVSDASLYFEDGSPLTGQSDHLANLQLGLEDTERLQQLTFLVSYASDRVLSRGFNNQPPIIEEPGVRLDVVARQGFEFGETEAELKLEVRNILGEDHEEYQDNGTNRVEFNTYDVGTTYAASLSVTF